jgi:hypothetical protein
MGAGRPGVQAGSVGSVGSVGEQWGAVGSEQGAESRGVSIGPPSSST